MNCKKICKIGILYNRFIFTYWTLLEHHNNFLCLRTYSYLVDATLVWSLHVWNWRKQFLWSVKHKWTSHLMHAVDVYPSLQCLQRPLFSSFIGKCPTLSLQTSGQGGGGGGIVGRLFHTGALCSWLIHGWSASRGIDLDERGCQLCLEVPPVHDILFRDLQGSTVTLESQPSIDHYKDDSVPKNCTNTSV